MKGEIVYPVRLDPDLGARTKAEALARKVSVSALIRGAIAREIDPVPAPPEVALPVAAAPATRPDAVRLRSAIDRSGLTLRGVAHAADLGHHTTVSRVLAGHLALDAAGGGTLLAWVAGVEGGGR